MLGGHRFQLVALCILWYVVSSSNNVIGKMVFNSFPYPTTVTMVQLLSISVYSGPFFKLWGVRPRPELPRKYYMRLIIPLAVGKFLASVTSHISLWKVPVSYAHTGEQSISGEEPFIGCTPEIGVKWKVMTG